MCKIKVSTINDDEDLKFPHEAFHILCLVQKATAVLTHNLYVLEQAEYLKEGKDWEMVGFGMDLQSCITMFEEQLGILAILQEESLFPKAKDLTLKEKLRANHLARALTLSRPPTCTTGANILPLGTVLYNKTSNHPSQGLEEQGVALRVERRAVAPRSCQASTHSSCTS